MPAASPSRERTPSCWRAADSMRSCTGSRSRPRRADCRLGTALRILHTESSLGWGGQEIRILTEAAGMIARGHQVELACPRRASIHAEAARHGVPVHALALDRKRPRGVIALRRLLSTNAFDVINAHSSTDAWLAALASRT